MKKVYGKYGHCWIKNYSGTYHFDCALNNTFSFLVPKKDKIEDWILKNNEFFLSFFAGYVDAEGTIKIYDKRARFRVGSYDKNFLLQFFKKLSELGIEATYKLETKASKKQHGDFWRIGISRMESLLNLFNLIEQYMKHNDRLSDLKKAKENVLLRLKKRG